MAADSLLMRRAFFTAVKRRPKEARLPASKKARREKAGSVQQVPGFPEIDFLIKSFRNISP